MTIEERKKEIVRTKQESQKLCLEDRKNLRLTGVSEVESFSESVIIARTCMGKVIVKGESLKISKLNVEEGELSVEGKINSIEYTKNKEKGGFFENIFR